jgi:hypothetical protein
MTTTYTAKGNEEGNALLPYKVYKALLTQSGTDAPVATVLQNTLNLTPSFRYDSPGFYLMEFPEGTFEEGKTIVLIQNNTIFGKCFTSCYVAANDFIVIRTFDDSFTDVDGKLYKTSILIEVYP